MTTTETITERLAALEASLQNRECVGCQSQPKAVYYRGAPGLRCNCGPKANGLDPDGNLIEPKLRREENIVSRRYRQMTNQQMDRAEERGEKGIVRYDTERGEVALSVSVVRQLFEPKATELECYAFIKFCQAYALNPHLREAYLIKYDAKAPASIVIGKAAFLARAEQNPAYDGFEDGIVVEIDGVPQDIPGTIVPNKGTLIGGWCAVYRKDRRMPVIKRVALSEYDRGRSLWNTHKATMINKVAIVQAHRDANPGLFAMQQDAGRVQVERADPPLAVLVEGVDIEEPTVEPQDSGEPENDIEAQASLLDEPKPNAYTEGSGH